MFLILALLVLAFGPRFFLLLTLAFQWSRFAPVFEGTIWWINVLAWLFVPWTIFAYAFMAPITSGWETLILVIAVIVDLGNLLAGAGSRS